MIAVILFIPIRRYTVGGGLPFPLEPYRLLIAVVLFAWLLALLVDPRRALAQDERGGARSPCSSWSILAGLALNIGWIASHRITGEVIKQLSFLASFLLVMYFVASMMNSRRARRHHHAAGGRRHLRRPLRADRVEDGLQPLQPHAAVLPACSTSTPSAIMGPPARGGRVRAFASAQHPIALGARSSCCCRWRSTSTGASAQAFWMAAAALLTMGALATGSRTAASMLIAELLVFFWMKRAETVRLLPMLVPLLVACQIVMPGTLGTFRAILSRSRA